MPESLATRSLPQLRFRLPGTWAQVSLHDAAEAKTAIRRLVARQVGNSAALLSAGVTETTLAEAREFANGTALYSYLQTPDASALVGSLGIDTPPTRDQYATDAAFITGANDWYQDNRPELDAAAKIALNNQYFELDVVLQPYTAQAGDAEGEQLKP